MKLQDSHKKQVYCKSFFSSIFLSLFWVWEREFLAGLLSFSRYYVQKSVSIAFVLFYACLSTISVSFYNLFSLVSVKSCFVLFIFLLQGILPSIFFGFHIFWVFCFVFCIFFFFFGLYVVDLRKISHSYFVRSRDIFLLMWLRFLLLFSLWFCYLVLYAFLLSFRWFLVSLFLNSYIQYVLFFVRD